MTRADRLSTIERLMRGIEWLLASVIVAGCATPKAAAVAASPRSSCTIVEVHWAGAEDDYDRPATIDALTAIETVVRDQPAHGTEAVAGRADLSGGMEPALVRE